MQTILVIGCGYAGERVARRHIERGDAVIAATRDPARGARLRALGAEVIGPDLDSALPALPAAARVYYAAPPPPTGLHDTRLAAVLEVLPPPGRFVYFGTTGVYGDHGGERVDESVRPAPASDRGRRRLDAETRLRSWAASRGVACAVLRIAGIYGPGRLPVASIAAGEPSPAGTGPGNRIHVDDLAAAAVAVGDFGEPGTWNVSDGNPLSVADFRDLIADAAALPRPRRVPLNDPEISAGMRSFLRDSRRIDNRRLLAVPGFTLKYRDVREGIRASLAEERVADD